MFRIKLIKGRLELIFKMRSLRIFEDNACIEAKGFIIWNYCFLSWLFFLVFRGRGIFGVGEDLFQKGILFNNFRFLSRRFIFFGEADNEIFVLILKIFFGVIEEGDTRVHGCGWNINDRFTLFEWIVELIYFFEFLLELDESFVFLLTSHINYLNVHLYY